MEIDINIFQKNDFSFFDTDYEVLDSYDGKLTLNIIINENKKEDIFKKCNNKKEIDNAVKKFIDDKACINNEDYDKGLLNKLLKMDSITKFPFKINVMNNDLEYTKKLLLNNNYIKLKEVIMHNVITSNLNKIYDMKEVYKDYDNVKVFMDGNDNPYPIDDLVETMDYINKVVNKIKKLNLSPLETLMYVFDFVRDDTYKREDEDESKSESRDLTRVILGDKKVCRGFSNLYNIIVMMLGIKVEPLFLYKKDKNGGHQRSLVYISDKKYNVEGIYEVDPTWNCRKDDSNDFFNNYKYFLKTKEYMDEFDKKRGLIDETLKNFSAKVVEKMKQEYDQKSLHSLSNDLISDINAASYFMNRKRLIPLIYEKDPELLNLPCVIEMAEYEEIIGDVERLCKLVNNEVKASTMQKLLYNVRKIEYYENESYPFSIGSLLESSVNSNWKFNDTNFFEDDNIEYSILEKRKDGKYYVNPYHLFCFRTYVDEEELPLKIERVKLAKTLNKLYNIKNKSHL